MTTEADVNRIFRRERNKQATDAVCKWFGIAVATALWIGLVSAILVEMGK